MLRSPLVQLVIALAIAFVIGAVAGGAVFETLTHVVASLFVRLSLGIAACCFLGFLATLVRLLRGLPPIDLAMPSALSPLAALVVTIAAAVLIATTVFR
ncbi:MAG TPA: hypothetical protein VEU77_02320 [Candidatus Acidoferrales bacterium]|nr:hypothetical protein [Candidatus Acidoferrales bacterium]